MEFLHKKNSTLKKRNYLNEKDTKKKKEKKESPVWGYLTNIYCGLGFLGLIYEFWFKFSWFN